MQAISLLISTIISVWHDGLRFFWKPVCTEAPRRSWKFCLESSGCPGHFSTVAISTNGLWAWGDCLGLLRAQRRQRRWIRCRRWVSNTFSLKASPGLREETPFLVAFAHCQIRSPRRYLWACTQLSPFLKFSAKLELGKRNLRRNLRCPLQVDFSLDI